jgi:hypothetical protein
VSVVSGKFIFCEGKENSLDIRLLNRILERIPAERVTIVPSGGKFSFSVFISGYLSSTNLITITNKRMPEVSNSNKRYIVFRDRDFDQEPSSTIGLIRLRDYFLTHRACVENYFLDADLIDSYWQEKYQEKQDNPGSKWGHSNSPGVEIISEWIKSAAKNLAAYQAVRWSLGNLSQNTAGRSQIKTTWTKNSGRLPESLVLEECRTEAIQLITQFKEAVDTITPEKFEENLAKYQEQFDQDEFWSQKQYLIWFHGKDIQKQMQIQEPQYISLSHFFNWAIANFEIDQHPDLIELQGIIEQL